MCKEWKQDVDEALKQGHASGVAEGKLETAKAMLKDGLPAEKIALYTGLSASEIADLTVQ